MIPGISNLKDPLSDDPPAEPNPHPLSKLQWPDKEHPNLLWSTAAFNPAACLQSLPAELKLMVMQQLNSVFELRCLITASSDYFRALRTSFLAAKKVVEILTCREKLSMLREYIEMGNVMRHRYPDEYSKAERLDSGDIPSYIPTNLLAKFETYFHYFINADTILVRTFYGDESIDLQTADTEWSNHELNFYGGPHKKYLRKRPLTQFNDPLKYDLGSTVFYNAPSLAPWLLHALVPILRAFRSDVNNDYQCDYADAALVFVFDKLACEGGGLFYFGVSHRGLTRTGDLIDVVNIGNLNVSRGPNRMVFDDRNAVNRAIYSRA